MVSRGAAAQAEQGRFETAFVRVIAQAEHERLEELLLGMGRQRDPGRGGRGGDIGNEQVLVAE